MDAAVVRPLRYRDGMQAALGLGVAVFAFGASFGVLARAAGFPTLAALVMSMTTFGGSAQFATVSVLSAGGGVAAAVAAATMLNARYGPIGLSAASALRGWRGRRLLEAQLIVDESWALAGRGGHIERHLLLGAGVVMYTAWVTGTAVGLAFGGVLGDPTRIGLDAAFPALFLGLLVTQLRSRDALLAAVLGAVIAVALIPVLRPGLPIICSCAACAIGWRRR